MVDGRIVPIFDESDYESDETDQVLVIDEHIMPMADPHWRNNSEFSTGMRRLIHLPNCTCLSTLAALFDFPLLLVALYRSVGY